MTGASATSATSIAASDRERQICVDWEDGHRSRFPYVWLRHELHMGAFPGGVPRGERTRDADDASTLAIADLVEDGGAIAITWRPDGALTRHMLSDLRKRCPSPEARAARTHRPTLWNGAIAEATPWHSWRALCELENARFRFFQYLVDFGFARIEDLPPRSGEIEKLAAMLGPVHETGYGRLFDVRSDSTLKLGANTSVALGPHTDENYRHAPPGVTIFHCLVSNPAGGGKSILIDGFEAARRLGDRDPDAFRLLSEVPLGFCETSDIDDYRTWGRVITLDRQGNIAGIRYTDRTIAPLDMDLDLMEDAYRSLGAFADILAAPSLVYEHLLQPGQVHVFDNQRVLHGRTAFDPAAGPRHLQQCAVDRDEFHRNFRILARRLGHPSAELELARGALA